MTLEIMTPDFFYFGSEPSILIFCHTYTIHRIHTFWFKNKIKSDVYTHRQKQQKQSELWILPVKNNFQKPRIWTITKMFIFFFDFFIPETKSFTLSKFFSTYLKKFLFIFQISHIILNCVFSVFLKSITVSHVLILDISMGERVSFSSCFLPHK